MFNMSEWWFRCEHSADGCPSRASAGRVRGGGKAGGGSSPCGAEPEVEIITAAASVKVFFWTHLAAWVLQNCYSASVCFFFLHRSLCVESLSHLEMFISVNVHFPLINQWAFNVEVTVMQIKCWPAPSDLPPPAASAESVSNCNWTVNIFTVKISANSNNTNNLSLVLFVNLCFK